MSRGTQVSDTKDTTALRSFKSQKMSEIQIVIHSGVECVLFLQKCVIHGVVRIKLVSQIKIELIYFYTSSLPFSVERLSKVSHFYVKFVVFNSNEVSV